MFAIENTNTWDIVRDHNNDPVIFKEEDHAQNYINFTLLSKRMDMENPYIVVKCTLINEE